MFRGYKKSDITPGEVRMHFTDDDMEEKTRWMHSKFTHYIFVDDREERNHGVCSNCGEDVVLDGITIHNSWEQCPSCGEILMVKHIWRGTGDCKQHLLFYVYEKSAIDKDAIGCRVISAGHDRDIDRKSSAREWAHINYHEDSYTLFLYGQGAFQIEENWYEHYWQRTATLTDRSYFYHLPHFHRIINKNWIREAVEGTPFEWSMWENFAEYNSGVTHNDAETFIRYFDLFAKYEAVEYLAKTGLFRMIQMYLWGNMTGRAVNWHGRTPNEIFKTRTTKADRKFLLNNGRWLDFSSIKNWETVNRVGRNRYSLEDVTRLLHGVRGMPKLLFQYVTIEKAIAYLKRQRENGSNGSIRDYEDYIRECLELGLDMKSKSTLYPKNLLQAHENLGKQIEYKKEEELEEQWIKRRESMKKKYGFSWQGMHIVVPEQVSDLITEGKAQKNCVGGYMQRVAKGETDVVFIRRDTEPENSYITMEIKQGHIVQARTKCNGPLDEAGQAFVDVFRAERLEKKNKRVRISA